VAVSLLVYESLGGAVSYYLTVSELLDKGSELYGERIRVAGKVVDNSIEWDADTLELRFVITEGGDELLLKQDNMKVSAIATLSMSR